MRTLLVRGVQMVIRCMKPEIPGSDPVLSLTFPSRSLQALRGDGVEPNTRRPRGCLYVISGTDTLTTPVYTTLQRGVIQHGMDRCVRAGGQSSAQCPGQCHSVDFLNFYFSEHRFLFYYLEYTLKTLYEYFHNILKFRPWFNVYE